MRKSVICLLVICFIIGGCSRAENTPELHPLSKHGDFYVGVNADGETYYVDFDGGLLCVIGPGRTALEKYSCDTPKLLSTIYSAAEITAAGEQAGGAGGVALGNLYITSTEIITFNFAELSIMEKLPLKKAGVTRISNYDVFVDKQSLLWAAVNDASEYKVTIDTNENPVLYRDDRIVYFEGEQVYIKNVNGLYEEPVSFKDYYDGFVLDQGRIELLRRSNNLYDFYCLIFDENICFISDSGHLLFSK